MKKIFLLVIFLVSSWATAAPRDCSTQILELVKPKDAQRNTFLLPNGYVAKEQSFVQKLIDILERAPYFTPEEQAQHKIHVVDGQLYNSLNQKLNTHKAAVPYIMDENLDIYILQSERLDPNNESRMHHSHLARGSRITAAGRISVENGIITYVDNYSGHYGPEISFLGQFAKRLKDLKVSLSRTYFYNSRDKLIPPPPAEFAERDLDTLKHHYDLNRMMEVLVTPVYERSESERQFFEKADFSLRLEARRGLSIREIKFYSF